ncbi:hypothetical protein D3C76_1315800 [compost metagenome]
MGEEVLRLQAWGVRPQLQLQHFQLISAKTGHGLLPSERLAQLGTNFFGFKSEFVVKKLVEKNLGYDFEFIPIVAQTIVGASLLKAVDHAASALLKFLRYHVRVPIRLPEANSLMYSATTNWLMVREASGVSLIFWRFWNSPITNGIIIPWK